MKTCLHRMLKSKEAKANGYADFQSRGFTSTARATDFDIMRRSLEIMQLKDASQLSKGEIKRSYYELAKIYHPDASFKYKDGTKFLELQQSYEFLLQNLTLAQYLLNLQRTQYSN